MFQKFNHVLLPADESETENLLSGRAYVYNNGIYIWNLYMNERERH